MKTLIVLFVLLVAWENSYGEIFGEGNTFVVYSSHQDSITGYTKDLLFPLEDTSLLFSCSIDSVRTPDSVYYYKQIQYVINKKRSSQSFYVCVDLNPLSSYLMISLVDEERHLEHEQYTVKEAKDKNLFELLRKATEHLPPKKHW